MTSGLDRSIRNGAMRFHNWRMANRPMYRRCGLNNPAQPVYASCNVRTIDARIVVSHPNRFVFVRVPKCANTTLFSTLWIQEQGLAPDYLSDMSDEERRRALKKKSMSELFARLSQLSAAEAAAVHAHYRKCIFVRNPFTRIASAYFHKIHSGDAQDRTGIPAGADFSRFCDYLEAGGLYEDIHWLPQSLINPFPVDELDLVGRFENLGPDLERMQQLLYGTTQSLVSVDHHATGANERVRSLYGDEEIARIAALYAEDFRAFAYDPERLP